MAFARLHFGTQRQAKAFRWLSRTSVTHESLATYIADCTGQVVDRSLVTSWGTGRRPVDLEAWLLALEHADDQAHVVLDALAAEHGCVVVRTPDPLAGAPAPTRRALLVAALAGEVARLTAAATDPDGDGGDAVTEAERALIADVERQLSRVLATPAGQVGR